MLGATAASTKYKSATTTQNIETSPTGLLSGRVSSTASSAVPRPETSTNTRSPAAGYWIGTMLPVMTIIPRRNGVPAAASLSASQASAFSGWPITSPPFPLPISLPVDREPRREPEPGRGSASRSPASPAPPRHSIHCRPPSPQHRAACNHSANLRSARLPPCSFRPPRRSRRDRRLAAGRRPAERRSRFRPRAGSSRAAASSARR